MGQVGRLLKHKGFQVTISAAKELIRENPKVHFLFVGEGPDEDWLKEQSRGLGNVEFVGYQENVGNWISAFDIFLFPSLTEGLGSTILEAMQLDVPVIAARAGGIPDLVADHVNGLLVPPGDASALSRAISQLVDNPSLSSSLKKGARLNLHKFSPQRMATEYRSLYQDILHGHS